MTIKFLQPLVLLVSLILLACGPTGSSTEPGALKLRRLPPEQFDLLKSAFHRSSVSVEAGDRVEVAVEVTQGKDDFRVCGVPRITDPFGNLLQTLTPTQDTQSETDDHYVYEFGYAFFPAIEGEFVMTFENRECIDASLPATATVRWSVFAAPPD